MNCNYCLYLHTGTYDSTKTELLLTFSLFIAIMNQVSHFRWGATFFWPPPVYLSFSLQIQHVLLLQTKFTLFIAMYSKPARNL